MLLAEHSPIRSCLYRIVFKDMKSWVATHFVRHHIGIEKFVRTQRPDRTDPIIERDSLPQGALVDVHLVLNAQSWINISRKRLCQCASPETREAWNLALDKLNCIDPELKAVCVKECLYRGFCPEIKSCGYVNTASFTNLLLKYRYGGEYGRKENAQSESKLPQPGICELQKQESETAKQGTKSKTPRKTARKTARTKRKTSRASKTGTGNNEA